MKAKIMFAPVDWIDPTLLPKFEYGAITQDQRTILIGYLDLSRFPTVAELQESLPRLKTVDEGEPLHLNLFAAFRGWVDRTKLRLLGTTRPVISASMLRVVDNSEALRG
jgi:hypothetical protein